MSGVNDIRSAFLDYFGKNGHEIVPSSPLVPRNDPTLMFTNAGMVQFKNVFTGLEKRPYRGRHRAEMRARRRQAQRPRQCRLYRAPPHLLRDAGQFLLRRLFQGAGDRARLEPDHQGIRPRRKRLLVTVYHADDEAFGLWKKIAGFPKTASSALRPATISGRWAIPVPAVRARRSSTIMASISGAARPARAEEDGDRFIEIWNLVFMQYEQMTRRNAIDLPRPSIDTGMGLERIAGGDAGQARQLRHRPVPRADRGLGGGDRRRCRGRAPRQPPRHRRPPALVRIPDRRRRAAVE